ncbi:MAG: SCO1664 family protein [Anaerolineales bacterium]
MQLELPLEVILETLSTGEIGVSGQFVWGSNRTFLVDVSSTLCRLQAIYKPAEGEQPLWDFPAKSLAPREVAAYLVSEALGWELVPPTVLRSDGPGGGGSLQLYLPADPERHYFAFEPAERQRLRPAAVLDVLINNADRKAGHVLLSPEGHVWLIDHGVCFHEDYKLRTVIWDFAGEPIPAPLLADIERLRSELDENGRFQNQLAPLLSPAEIRALRDRSDLLLAERTFPHPGPGRPFPWPLV